MAKLLWNLSGKANNLWIKWVHTYYIKNTSLMSVQVNKNISWIIKVVLKQRYITQSMNDYDTMTRKFETKKVYNFIKEEYPKVDWRHLLYMNFMRPRALFVIWLAFHNRLTTKERLHRFGLLDNNQCNFCLQMETINHFFFSCPRLRSIWKEVLERIQTIHGPDGWNEEIK
ncbi:unnamed protein product [Lathyrus oleraceus]